MKIISRYGYDAINPPISEEIDTVSVAVPDQTYTIKELFDRMARGLPLDKAQPMPTYYDDELDPTEEYGYDISDAYNELEQLEQKYENSIQEHSRSDEDGNGKGESEAKQSEA